MAFQMKVSNEQIKGKDVIPPGIYDLKLIGFKPAKSKAGDSISLNPCMEVQNHPEFAGRKVFDTLNSKGAWTWPAFVECFGMRMEGDGKDSWIPGDWNGDVAKFKEDDPSTWVYRGPLVGRTGKAEIKVDNYNGKDNNKVEKYLVHPTVAALPPAA